MLYSESTFKKKKKKKKTYFTKYFVPLMVKKKNTYRSNKYIKGKNYIQALIAAESTSIRSNSSYTLTFKAKFALLLCLNSKALSKIITYT